MYLNVEKFGGRSSTIGNLKRIVEYWQCSTSNLGGRIVLADVITGVLHLRPRSSVLPP